MPIPGSRWARSCIRPLDRLISRIDSLSVGASWRITLRIAAGLLPALAGSLLWPWLTPVFTLAALVTLYVAARPVQDALFDLTAKEKYWHLFVPLHAGLLLWAALLVLAGSPLQIGRTVGTVALLTAVAVWPIYMGRKAFEKKRRKVSFAAAYATAGTLAALQQIAIITGEWL